MKTLSIDVRRAIPDDAEAIAAVHDQSWRAAYTGLIPYGSLLAMIGRRGPAWWDRALRKSPIILVLTVGGVIAGYATMGRSRSGNFTEQGEIYEIYLSPEFQGIGFGRCLFDEARATLNARGFVGLVVWSLEVNEQAIGFYQAMGGIDRGEGVEIFDSGAMRKVAFTWV